MNGQGWFIDQNQSLVHESEIGVPDPSRGTAGRPVTRTSPTRTRAPLQRIGGNPNGTWESIKTWWLSLKPEYRYGIVAAPFLVGVIVAAVQGKGSTVKKI